MVGWPTDDSAATVAGGKGSESGGRGAARTVSLASWVSRRVWLVLLAVVVDLADSWTESHGRWCATRIHVIPYQNLKSDTIFEHTQRS
ncbi:hypothetical protein BVRB_4g082630 [Beta vulgaris subsp. vulgaris]|nr:hypothetical protein BVRB_4g082630 [Beta vulgaris subsp. vulgaris]